MAWQYPKHSCGHDGDWYQAYGHHSGRERQLNAIESRPCPDCRKIEADKKSEESGLPLLQGSPKQVAWATDIRERKLRLNPELVEKLKPEKSAKWWIENR